jgi:hypothetical protein
MTMRQILAKFERWRLDTSRRSSNLVSCLGVEVCWNLEVRVLACVMRKEVHVQSCVAWLL